LTRTKVSNLAAQGWGAASSEDEEDDGRRYNETDSSDESNNGESDEDEPMHMDEAIVPANTSGFLQEQDWIGEYIDPRLL
jgi:hypothetical protein